MKLYIKEAEFSWEEKFIVADENGKGKYKVEGEVFTVGNMLHIYDRSSAEVAYVEQKMLSYTPKFYVYAKGERIAEIVREFEFLNSKYNIIGKGWIVEGDVPAHDYTIVENGNVIGGVHKVSMSWGETIELDIYDLYDEVSLLAVVLGMDAVKNAAENSNTGI